MSIPKGKTVFLTCSPPPGGQRAGGQKQSANPAANSPSAGKQLVVIHGGLNMGLWMKVTLSENLFLFFVLPN